MENERTYYYKIDTEGRLWHEGSEITDPKVLKFFMKKMERLEDGRIQVLCMGEKNFIEVEDVPYVVQEVRIKTDEIDLIFPGGYRERLNPNTLFVGKGNVMYCKIRTGTFKARFNRKPYLELSRLVGLNKKTNGYYLKLKNQKYPIRGV